MKDGKLRSVIAAIAFGIGIGCPNIYILRGLLGSYETVEDYVQEIGREG